MGTIVIRLAGIGIFLFILTRLDFAAIAAIWRGIDLVYLGAVIGLTLVLTVARAFKWLQALRFLRIPMSISTGIGIFWAGIFCGMVTPGRIGDLAKIFFIEPRNGSRLPALASVLLDRFADFLFLFFFGLTSAHIVLRGSGPDPVLAMAVLALCLMPAAIPAWRRGLAAMADRLLERFAPVADPGSTGVGRLAALWAGADKAALAKSLLWLPLCWSIYFVNRYLLALALGIALPFWPVVLCSALATIVALIPVSISGIGTRDAAFVYLFSRYGIAAEAAIAYSIMILLTESFVVSLGYIPYHRLAGRLGTGNGRLCRLFSKTP